MPAFQRTGDQFRAFRDDPYEGPIAQVNLLKFRVKAQYQPDDAEFGNDEPGSAAYMRYAEAFGVIAAEVGGAPLLLGEVERYFIGNGDWDAVMVMRFPSRAAFTATLNHERYAEISRHATPASSARNCSQPDPRLDDPQPVPTRRRAR